MSEKRVVIYTDHHGNWSVQADEGVTVYSIVELVPDDRVYRMEPDPIDETLLIGEVHHKNDGSPAAARISKAVKEANGIPFLEPVKH